jgi:glycosyltransferase involved in cell wall biosynthesis
MNDPEPLVSVVMPVFNSERFLTTAIDSVLAQSWKNFELILVDDASTDRSWAIIESYRDSRIRRWRLNANSGPAHTRNQCLSHATGEYVAFIDSDDIAAPGLLEYEVRFLQSNPKFQMVAAWREIIDENGRRLETVRDDTASSDRLGADMLFVNRLPTTSLLVKRTLLSGERFDPAIEIASDYEMWTRLTGIGSACFLPRILAQYRVYPGNITHRKQAAAAASLREIMRRQTSRLGLTASDSELAIHLQIPHLTVCTSKETVILAEQWLLKLAEANRKATKYPQSTFEEMLLDRWYGVCHSACEHGVWTWRRFIRSRICEWSSVGSRRKVGLAYRASRACLKHTFPFLTGLIQTKAH